MEKDDVKDDRGGILTPPCVINELLAMCDDGGNPGLYVCDVEWKLSIAESAAPWVS